MNTDENKITANFISEAIDRDLAEGVYNRVQTRFPPEPNGYLHIGHAKAISIDFGMAEKYGGTCNLRFDDTNPTKEDAEYAGAIEEDIRWLGYRWDKALYASSYFDFIYECAVGLIHKGLAYVDDLTADQIRAYRGTLTEPGRESPGRRRPIEESLALFARMTAGAFPNGAMVLRAKIDMASPNLNLRDPVLYRILHASHHQTGDKWCVYPMYDFAHPLSDAAEGVTHSLCSLEFENHRPLYDWCLAACGIPNRPRQIEFARMNVNHTLTSKRKCLRLVSEGLVSGWDDPRMATLRGMRRRGYPPEAIRDFCERIGVAKAASVIDYALLEACVRDRLNQTAPRAMAVLDPVRLVIDNYPEGRIEDIDVEINPNRPELGTRKVSFGRELYIERADFNRTPPPKYHRLYPGGEVRLKGAYLVRAVGCETDGAGGVTCVHAVYDPDSRGGEAPDGRKVKGTLHWTPAHDAVLAEVRLYDRLFNTSNPSDEEGVSDFAENLNPGSLTVLTGCRVEAALANALPGDAFQFLRQGYFCVDADSAPGRLVFNRTVALRDAWSKTQRVT
jgi:glutaminyl-tRNA synthetase